MLSIFARPQVRLTNAVGFLVVLNACDLGDTDGSMRVSNMEVVRTLGWASIEEADRPLSEIERQYQGAVLGRVTAIEEDLEGNLYALDPQFRKVVVFDSEGRFARVVPLPSGVGPGEFNRVRSLAVRGDGSMLILDGANNRITELHPEGAFARQFAVQGYTPFYVWAPDEERTLVARSYRTSGTPALMMFDREGNVVDSLFVVSEEEADRGAHGEWGDLLISSDGTLMFTPVIPGEWHTSSGETVGSPMFPEDRGQTLEFSGAMYFPVMPRGSAWLSDGSVLQFYFQAAGPDWTPESEHPMFTPHLVQLSLRGGAPQNVELPFDLGDTRLWPSSKPDHVFFVQNNPHPQIVEVRVSLDR